MEERQWTYSSILISIFVLINLSSNQIHANDQTHVRGLECYDHYGRPQRCIPPFENAAFNLRIEATNTCGEEGDTHFCVQTGYSNKKSCDVCTEGTHGPEYLTDAHNPSHSTWWQSETIFEGVQYPNKVNLTLNLGKSFDITYIRIVFYSPRPESFAIYKRQTQNGSWIPYQYYSATCRDTYRLPDSLSIKRNEDEARALCTSEYSDISPLRDGNIAFSSLEGRPSAYNFENSTELQNWVTATDIQITLHRLNTFGDEVFGDPQVLRSYFYAIADIAVGARCKCNGHASKCVESTGLNNMKTRVCECKHFTDGPDCEKCLPFYNDAPWGRATSTNVHECKEPYWNHKSQQITVYDPWYLINSCTCNGYSNKCFFDRHLYNLTKHGGHCQDCQANRDGPNCERCKENFYMREDGYCINCNCDSVGSRSLQCNTEGKCQCKPGVTGDKCDRCDNNFYNFGPHGCQQCGCDLRGSLDNTPSCDAETGECVCKENVEGRRCRECKPGFFSLDSDNKFGCTPCFCYGHTSECQSANGYSIVSTSSNFNKHKERWNAVDAWNNMADLKYSHFGQNIATASKAGEEVYFSAPDRFLGDQRASYNRLLNFKLQLTGQIGPNPSTNDVILEGAGTKISLPIFAQSHYIPDQQIREYSFRLHEHPEYSWQPSQSSRGFMSILSNLTAIKIRATYSNRGEAFLDDFELNTAHKRAAGRPATWIEQCTCPTGYLGQFCESCAPGYRHSPAHGGPFMPCIPCDCNKHADICDSETGRCICQHNTAGDTCDQCARGYYGNALGGTPYDCKKCPCPDDGACMQIADESVICLECPVGYFGSRCELCSDGYFGDPTGVFGRGIRLCKPCDCNGNVDPNAVGNCNHTSGECLKCIHNTDGTHCDQCLPGHFGDPLAIPHGKCDECICYPAGTEQTLDGINMCDQLSGNCRCKANVIGKQCNECKNGFFNIASGNGCETCNCNTIGSFNSSCERFSGQCYCKPGVTGLRCDQCVPLYYGFSSEGCNACECDPSGSKGLQCDQFGQCPCNDNVEGKRCDRCKENKYDRHQGCINCPSCYNLVQDAADDHRKKLHDLNDVLMKIASNPTVINDGEFEFKLKKVQEDINILLDEARFGSGGSDRTPKEKLDDFANRLEKVRLLLGDINVQQADVSMEIYKAEKNVSESKNIIEEATKELANALDLLKTEGAAALKRAEEKSEQLGQQSGEISDISQEARKKANEIELEVATIKNLTNLANSTAHDAYDKTKSVITLIGGLSDELGTNISQEMTLMKDNLEITKVAVNNALKKSNETYDEVLTTVGSINSLALPNVNISEIKMKTEKALVDAIDITESVQNAINNNQKIVEEFLVNLEFSGILLDRYNLQKEESIEKLEKVKELYEKAQNAVTEGDNTLKEANNTYHTLAGFQNQVQESSNKAKIALDSVPIIEEQILEAIQLNQQTEQTLSGAHANAITAKKNAQHAQTKYAEQASKDAEAIREKANATKNQARKLRGEADQLSGRVVATEVQIEKLEDMAKKDDGLAQDTKAKVGQAKSDSIDAKNQVEKAMNEVQAIIDELSNLREIDEAALNSLDERLTKSEEELERANLALRIDSLQEMKAQQNKWMEEYNSQIKSLEDEVDNIKLISEALPEGCFKRIRLEI